ncbi:piggyBac transposable element-derived protein 4-like [Amphiura filiformis]|uniref:piggyBac transposable element-derived protein 4-like n=1 Tax=Amphiura filiformis TaxID=82378 RepID=UPI003B21A16A
MRSDPMYPLKGIWEAVRKSCNRKYNCRQQLAVDEAMIKYKGYRAKVRKFFMQTKSATGFMCNFVCLEWGGEVSVKMVDITLDVTNTHTGVFHHVFTDKLYSSIEVAKRLLSLDTYFMGTIKISSKDWPVDLSSNPQKNPNHQKVTTMAKTPPGTIYTRQSGQLTAILWKESKTVSLLSTAHQGYRDKDEGFLMRKRKDDGMKKRKSTWVNAPPQAVSYTECMGGVDRADQLRAYYTCSRKSQKWWNKILYFLVDICRVNGYICYKQRIKHPKSHSTFIMDLAMGFIAGFKEGRAKPHQSLLCVQLVPRRNGPRHQAVRLVEWPKACVWCWICNNKTASNNKIKTRSGCLACNVTLCKGPCFTLYHSQSWVDLDGTDTEDASGH